MAKTKLLVKALKSALDKIPEKVGALPSQDEIDRLQRAKDLGFETDAFHGTRQEVAINPVEAIYDGVPRRILVEEEGAPIKEFLDKSDYEGDTPSIQDIGTFFSEDPDVASYFAGDGEFEAGQVYPVKLRLQNPKEYFSYEDFEEDFENFMTEQLQSGKTSFTDEIGSKAFREKLQSEGHDGILISRSTTDTGRPRQDYVVFDPKDIRSVFAKFDPTKKESKDILAGAGFTAFGTLGALAGLEDST